MTERVLIAVIAMAGTALAVASYVNSVTVVVIAAVLAGAAAAVVIWLVERETGAVVVPLARETAPGSEEEPRAGTCGCLDERGATGRGAAA